MSSRKSLAYKPDAANPAIASGLKESVLTQAIRDARFVEVVG